MARPPLSRAHNRPEAGFLLLEVLLAFLIAALALAVLVRGAAESSRAVRVALDAEEAVVRARSRLAALDRGGLAPGQRDGDDGGGFTWHTRIVPLATAADARSLAVLLPDAPMPRQTLYAVTVAIEWQAGRALRRFVLQSERLGPPPP
jgi:general secretion pathway protein I